MPNQIQKIIDESTKDLLQTLTLSAEIQEGGGHVHWYDLSQTAIVKTVIDLLSQEIHELEGMLEPNWKVMLEKGSEFTTPRMTRAIGYNQCLTDLITKKKQIMSELEK